MVTSIRDKTIPNPRKSELNDESLNSIIRCFCLFVCLLFFFGVSSNLRFGGRTVDNPVKQIQ